MMQHVFMSSVVTSNTIYLVCGYREVGMFSCQYHTVHTIETFMIGLVDLGDVRLIEEIIGGD